MISIIAQKMINLHKFSLKHIMLQKVSFTLIIALCFCVFANAQTEATISDSITTIAIDSIAPADSIATPAKKRNIFEKIVDYFDESNKPKEYDGFDFNIIGGPHYSSDTKFGIGLVAAGFYRHNANDSITPMSNVALYGDISSVGFYLVGLRGNHIFTLDKNRIDYNLYFYSFPREFWGIGYEQGNDMNNKSKFDEIYVKAKAAFLHEFAPNLYFGPGLEFNYAHASDITNPTLWEGLPRHTATYGAGVRLQYDTRDNLTATKKGILVQLEQQFCPSFLGNKQAFSYTDFRVSYFCPVWKGGTLAMQFHGKYNYGDTPWAMLATFGGSSTMRGYYEGRFRDKGVLDYTIELRQHVWRRNGLVAWLGVGTVFPKFSEIQFRKLLPNGGIGYRWELKKNTNVRLDFGVGKGETSFLFSINEAF